MAKDINKIRQMALQREGNETPDKPLMARPQKSISSLRVQEIRQDPGTQIVLDKAKTSKKLSKAIELKRQELQTIAEATKSIVAGANGEADRIVKETKEKASKLISMAKSDRNAAETLLNQNQTKENELKLLDEQISQRENNVKEKEQKIDIKEKLVNNRKEDVDNLLTSASTREKQAVEIFSNTIALFDLVFEQMNQLQILNSKAGNDISQTLVKTDRMIQRIAVLLKEVDAGNLANKEKVNELQKWQDGLIDREQMLDRTAKEIQQMKGSK